jgi:hypothetical protein
MTDRRDVPALGAGEGHSAEGERGFRAPIQLTTSVGRSVGSGTRARGSRSQALTHRRSACV